MSGHGAGCSPEVSRIWITFGLTVSWWSCAVGVTVLMKAALGGPLVSGLGVMKFPYPLTLTLLANVWTAALIDLLALLRKSWVRVAEARSLSIDTITDASSPGDRRQQGLPFTTPPPSPPLQQPRGTASGRAEPRHDMVALVTMGVMQGLGLGAKNEALLMLTVSTRTMIMATNVLVVMIIARATGLEKFGRTKILAGLLVAMGGVLQGVSHLEFFSSGAGLAASPGGSHTAAAARSTDHPLGYLLAMIALLLDASRWVLLQTLFKRTEQRDAKACLNYMPPSMGSPSGDPRAEALLDEKDRFDACERQRSASFRGMFSSTRVAKTGGERNAISKLSMVSAVMWSATPVVLVLSLIFEPEAVPLVLRNIGGLAAVIFMLAVGVLGINICEFGVVQYTSAVTFVVLSNLHSIPMVLSGIIFFREQVSLLEIMGFSTCILGSLLYSRAKTAEASSAVEA